MQITSGRRYSAKAYHKRHKLRVFSRSNCATHANGCVHVSVLVFLAGDPFHQHFFVDYYTAYLFLSYCDILKRRPRLTMDSYTWIFLVGIVVFFLVIVILLCFTKAGGDRLFLGSTHDPECISEIEETPALLATLSEDARISYEQAKGKKQRERDNGKISVSMVIPVSIPTTISS